MKSTIPKEIIGVISVDDLNAVTKYLNRTNLNIVDKQGRTLLHHAVISQAVSVSIFLISQNVLLNVHDCLGWAPLHYAAQNHNIDIANILLSAGAEVDVIDEHGNSALWRAVFDSKGRGEFIKLLLFHGAKRNLENLHGVSPIGLANTIANYNIDIFFK
jgi:ankyrin repeat protein